MKLSNRKNALSSIIVEVLPSAPNALPVADAKKGLPPVDQKLVDAWLDDLANAEGNVSRVYAGMFVLCMTAKLEPSQVAAKWPSEMTARAECSRFNKAGAVARAFGHALTRRVIEEASAIGGDGRANITRALSSLRELAKDVKGATKAKKAKIVASAEKTAIAAAMETASAGKAKASAKVDKKVAKRAVREAAAKKAETVKAQTVAQFITRAHPVLSDLLAALTAVDSSKASKGIAVALADLDDALTGAVEACTRVRKLAK